MYNIDVYYLKDSNLPAYLNNLAGNDKKISFKFINQGMIKIEKESKSNIFIFEEDSFLSSIELFEKIISIYDKKKCASIIVSNNRDTYNVVQWMRKGVSDYLVKGGITKNNFINSLNSSLLYALKKKTVLSLNENSNENADYAPIEIPKSAEWELLKNNSNYDISLMMVEINFDESGAGQLSKASIENINQNIRNEISIISKMFCGKLWFWLNNRGVAIFHFGDKINLSALACIYFYNHFFQICIEKLNLQKMPDIKIALHEGNTMYHNRNFEGITSTTINYLAHINKKFNKINVLNITENIYEKLNQRLKNYFLFSDNFQEKKIYQYRYFNY